MPKYRVREKSFLNVKGAEAGRICEEGEVVEFEGLPAENLEPLDAEGEAKYQEYLRSNEARVAKMIEQNRDLAQGIADPATFFAALQKMIAEAVATAVKSDAKPQPAADAKGKTKADSLV